MSKLQVLVATMHLNNLESLYKKMNLRTDALVVNQCEKFGFEEVSCGDACVECFSFNERGLSRSRNNALMRCTGDIICIADDDMIYSDTYDKDIIAEFENHPEADAIVFNVKSTVAERAGREIKSFKRVHKAESREYGSVHIAFRRNAVLNRNVYFNILFGSGAIYSCGEDTIFLKELIEKGFKLYKSPKTIGIVDMSESSWFNGYNEKYFYDKGALVACMYPHYKYILFIIQSIKNSKKYMNGFQDSFKLFSWYLKGAKDYVKRCKE